MRVDFRNIQRKKKNCFGNKLKFPFNQGNASKSWETLNFVFNKLPKSLTFR